MKKNILIVALLIIIVALTSLLIITKNNKDNQEENKIIDTNKYKEEDYIRNTNVILEEAECTGHKNDIEAKIENGNIIVTDNEKSITILTKEAKYLYKTEYIACNNVVLFFITNNGNLYQLNSLNYKLKNKEIKNNQDISISSLEIKKLSSNIKEFIGNSYEIDNEIGCSSNYITVVNNENETINYNYSTNCIGN